MAIDLEIENVEIRKQDRTREFTVVCPANGQYELLIYRHIIDKNTGRELERDAQPIRLNLAQMMADPQIPALLATIPPILDRVVQAARAD